MNKAATLLIALALCGLMTACNDTNASQPKIGVVDLNRIMRDSVPGKEGIKFIEAQQATLQKELNAIQEKLEKNPEDQAAMQELQKVYATSQQQMQAEGQNVVGTLFDAIQAALDRFREKNGYALLIRAEALDSFDQSLDVTNAIMAEVDNLKVDFKSVPAREEPAAPAASEKKDAAREEPAATPDASDAAAGKTDNAVKEDKSAK